MEKQPDRDVFLKAAVACKYYIAAHLKITVLQRAFFMLIEKFGS